MQTVLLKGKSGTTYKCEVYRMSMLGSFDQLEEVKAVYVFFRAPQACIYVGETKDVNDRLSEDHHQIDCIREKKATHILIYRDGKDSSLKKKSGRLKIEKDLKDRYDPECQQES